ncbi:MAG: hypothetical protein KKH94_10140 [Candidatus Omnitrophica bacterium]|nr:hypothetical protein [Candidatus Omnitrophota bacterium]
MKKHTSASYCKVVIYVLSSLFSVLFFVHCVYAQSLQYDITKGEYKRKDSERVDIVGKIVDIAQVLQHRAGGADAQGSIFSKDRQGLVTSGGKIWTFVDNIKGQDLQWNKDYLGKFIKIQGWVFHDAQYIEVDSFSVGSSDYVWSNTTNSFQPLKDNNPE